jgi:hypothetical protein
VTTLETLSKEWIIVRELYKSPWPMSNRDCTMIRKFQYNENCDMNSKAEDSSYVVEVPIVHPKCPPVKGVVRIEPGNLTSEKF